MVTAGYPRCTHRSFRYICVYMDARLQRHPIVVTTATFYTEADSRRFELALALVRESVAAGLPIVIADDSPSPDIATRLKEEGAIVLEEGGKAHGGGKGGGVRAALSHAVATFGEDGAVLFLEPEKCGLVKFAARICVPLLDKTASVVVPRRMQESFARTYPAEQFHSESFGCLALDVAAREARLALPPGLDWFFGPFAAQRARAVVEAWLVFAATDWTAQIVPFVKLAANGHTIVIADVDYEHPAVQKADEEGDGKWVRKRLSQLNAILPTLEGVFHEVSGSGAPWTS